MDKICRICSWIYIYLFDFFKVGERREDGNGLCSLNNWKKGVGKSKIF